MLGGELGVVDGKTAVGYVGGLDAGCEQVKRVGEWDVEGRGDFGECGWG